MRITWRTELQTSATISAERFVRHYYKVMQTCPEGLYRFYKHDSILIFNGQTTTGQPSIYQLFSRLNLTQTQTNILNVDAIKLPLNVLLIQVIGEQLKPGEPSRRFFRSLVVVEDDSDDLSILTDIVRFQKQLQKAEERQPIHLGVTTTQGKSLSEQKTLSRVSEVKHQELKVSNSSVHCNPQKSSQSQVRGRNPNICAECQALQRQITTNKSSESKTLTWAQIAAKKVDYKIWISPKLQLTAKPAPSIYSMVQRNQGAQGKKPDSKNTNMNAPKFSLKYI